MRPVPGDPPSGKRWAWEADWSGLRVIITNEPGEVRIVDGDGSDVADRFPELKRIGRAIGATEVVLDGVVVDGGSGALAARMKAAPSSIRRLSNDRPVQLVLVDAVWWEGHPAVELPWSDRRVLLESLDLTGGPWTTPTAHVGDGSAVVDAARSAGVGTLVAKRTTSPYRPGEPSDDWVLAQL
jgi:bifunctional non-homologous end joining protein LigD